MEIEIIESDSLDFAKLNTQNNLIFYPHKSKILMINHEAIGFYTTHIILGQLTLEYNLFEENRNKKFGFSFVNIITELVSRTHPEYDKIYLLIPEKEKKSCKVATQNGYELMIIDDFSEQVREEMPNYHIYCKLNEFYNRSNKEKKLKKCN